MHKYIVKNCPAGQLVTSAVNPDWAGVYCKMTHGPCQDCTDCLPKNIVTKFCGKTYLPEVDAKFEEVFNLMEIEEIKE